jgi:hypothetical protein
VSTATWKKSLEPFAAKWADLIHAIEDHARNLSDEDLQALIDATYRPTQTNCGWHVFGVAGLVREVAAGEHFRRQRDAAVQS